MALGACGDSAQTAASTIPSSEPEDGACETSFDSTFAAIRTVVFEREGCVEDACHGSARCGGLDLRSSVAYANLLEAPSTSSPHPRIQPGEPSESFLYLKLLAATAPDRSQPIGGSPMPVGRSPLSEDRPICPTARESTRASRTAIRSTPSTIRRSSSTIPTRPVAPCATARRTTTASERTANPTPVR